MFMGGGVLASEGRKFEMNRPSKRAWLALIVAALFVLSGCTTTTIARLDDMFDADTSGSPPSVNPPPSPPNDVLSWTTLEQVTSTVVGAPGGGLWLRITPTQAFVASPDLRKRAIIATSDTFTTSPPANIRGHLRLRLDGLGVVTIGLRPLQGPQFSDFICGIELANFAVRGGPRGEAHVLYGFPLTRIDDIYPLPTSGKMADYQAGTVIDINWSIDQASRTFAASVSGGPSQSTTFPAQSAGVATTPIQKLSFWVWLQKPSSNTAVFIDNLYAEEYK
jgi:hypothetical protein